MNPKESAFNDALVAVATSNTATYLLNRLRPHPLVQYLVDTFSLPQLKDRLLLELTSFDESLQSTTVILLLTQAILNKSATDPIPTDVLTALKNSKVIWVRELLSLAQAIKRNSAVTISNFRSSPSLRPLGSSSRTPHSFIKGSLG